MKLIGDLFMKTKKTERKFTKIDSVRHLALKLADHGNKIMFKYYGTDKEIATISYKEFSALVVREAAGLNALGLKGKRIAIVGETSPEWVASYIAIISMGGVAIPMDKELDIAQIDGFLTGVEAEAIIFSKGFNQKLEAMVQNHATLKKFIMIDPTDCAFENDPKAISFKKLLALGDTAVSQGYTLPEPEDMRRMAVMLFTSGTTGTSKCVMLCEQNVCAAVNAACECVEFFPDDVLVSVLPIHHTYELCCMLAGSNYGMEICINDSLRKVLKNFALFKPTGLILVPLFVNTMYKKIIETAKKQGKYNNLMRGITLSKTLRKVGIDVRAKLFKDVVAAFGGRLTKIVSGGAPLNPDMVEKFKEFGISIYEGYGITECSPLISVSPYFAPKPSSVGPAVNCCTVRIDYDGTVSDNGYKQGEIVVKGDNVMLGYYNNPEETAAVFTDDGYFRTGDLGYMDEDGYIYITGRKKFVIVMENGKNVFPEEIEEYLGQIEEIAECVVVGRKAEDSDAITLVAICYPNSVVLGDTSKEEAEAIIRKKISALNKKLTGYKRIQQVEFVDTEFPKTTSKKIIRQGIH